MARHGLGKGLSAIFDEDHESVQMKENSKHESGNLEEKQNIFFVRIHMIQPNLNQPRKNFDQDRLNELSESIKTYGVLQPILVRRRDAFYEIIAGERRWRAAKNAGLKEIPVIVKDMPEQEIREISLIENIQRSDLNPVEEALAYQSLIEEYGMTQEEVSEKVAKKRTTIANSLRLLKLEPEILSMLSENLISQGHARALLSIKNVQCRIETAHRIVKEELSVREVEKISKQLENGRTGPKKKTDDEDRRRLIYQDIEKRMKSKLGTKVSIRSKDGEKGKVEIEYYSEEDLDRIFALINSIE